MPVKNKSRLTNSGFKGVITSLNKEEKEVLANEGIASSDKVPTDIAVKDNKLGLEHDNVWLTNQNAINLGDNMTYDATTKTLNAKGGEQKKYYNHFITLMGTGVSCSFTITNSRPEPYTSVGDIYTYLRTLTGSISISATGSYSGKSGKGIISQLEITAPQGYSYITFANLEIEVVENVPTIKMTEKAASVYFSSVYSDDVKEL